MILFDDIESTDGQKQLDLMEKVAEQLGGKILLTYVDTESEEGQNMAEWAGAGHGGFPEIFIVEPVKDAKEKMYKFSGSAESVTDIVKFYEDWTKGELELYSKSEPIPKKQNRAVFQLVGLNFKKQVLESGKDVLVKFYAPWCGHCKKMAPKYKRLAKRLKNAPNVVIAEIDGTQNDVEGQDIEGFPTVKFFSPTQQEGLDFMGDVNNMDEMVKFLEENV